MKYTLEELKNEVFKEVYNVYEVFQSFFGEGFVDLQFNDNGLTFDAKYLIPSNINEESLADTDLTDEELNEAKTLGKAWTPYIYVWWPTVTVTNENGRSVVIQDLYAKITVSLDGTIPFEQNGFKMLRSTFSFLQFKEGYVHSHLPRILHSVDEVKEWRNPCLGSGPIRQTILDLHTSNEEALWMLFCQELSLYVTVESLAGGPYFRLEEIGRGTYNYKYGGYHFGNFQLPTFYPLTNTSKILRDFTEYYLENGHLSFSYVNNTFVPGMPYFDFIVDISNAFIEWYNSLSDKPYPKSRLFSTHLVEEVTTANRKIYNPRTAYYDLNVNDYEGTPIFTFKGKEVKLHINNVVNEDDSSKVILLSSSAADYIINNILKVINYRYENRYGKDTGDGEETSTTYKKVCYL